jgi:hypothetical protein
MATDNKLRAATDVHGEPSADAQERFHSHLEACSRRSDEPFNLCEAGERLLLEAVKEIREDRPP